MSSSHIIVVARNHKTGEIQLPLDDLTLYGVGGEEDVLETCRLSYDEDWSLALYEPKGAFYSGAKPARKEEH